MDLMSLMIRIGADITGAEKGMQQVQDGMEETAKKSTSFASKVKSGFKAVGVAAGAVGAGVAAATAAVVKLTTQAAATTDRIDKMSQKIGLSRTAFQEMDFIMSQSGGSVESLQVGMKTLRTTMVAAANGTKESAARFKQLGVSIKDSKGNLRNQEDVMFDTIAALQKVEDETQRAALATELFGKAGIEMVPLLNSGAGSIEEMKKKAHELGLVLDDEAIDSGVKLTDTIDQVKRAFDAIKTRIGVSLMPVVQNILEIVLDNMPIIQKVLGGVFGVLGKIVGGAVRLIGKVTAPIKNLIRLVVDTFAPRVKRVLDGIRKNVSDRLENIADFISGVKDKIVGKITDFLAPINKVVHVLQWAIGVSNGSFSSLITWFEWGLKNAQKWGEGNALTGFLLNVIIPFVKQAQESIENIMGLLAPLGNAVKNLFGTIRGLFTGESTFGDVKKAISGVWDAIMNTDWAAIGEQLKNVFLTAWESIKAIDWKGIADTVWEKIKAVGGWFAGLFNTALETIKGIDWKGIGTSVWNGIKAVRGWFVGMFNKALDAIKEIDWASIKNTVWDKIKALGSWFKGLFDIALVHIQGIEWGGIGEKATAGMSAATTFFNETLPGAISTVSEALKAFWDNLLVPIATYVSGSFKRAFKSVKDYWENDLSPKLAELKEAFDTFRTTVLEPIATFLSDTFAKAWEAIKSLFGGEEDGVEGSVNSLADTFKNLWEGWLKPIADWVTETFGTVWTGLETTLSGLVTFLTGVFSGDWEKAWNGLVQMIAAPFNLIGDLLKKPINEVIRIVNKMISAVQNAINTMIGGINNKLHLHFEGVYIGWPFNKQVAAFDWKPNIPYVRFGRVQALAKGGKVMNGGQAIVGEAGPEYLRVVNGKAIVTPTTGGGGGDVHNTFNIYQQPGEDSEALARRIERIIVQRERQRRAALA